MAGNPFDWVKAIGEDKRSLYEEGRVDYNPFMVNRAFSYYPDTVFYAQDMNLRHHLDNDIQHSYLMGTIRRRRRFSKWAKPPPADPALEAISRLFDCGLARAKSIARLLNEDDLEELRSSVEKKKPGSAGPG